MRPRRSLEAVFALVAAVAACAKTSPSPAPDAASAPVESMTTLRESARETLDANCRECHTTGLSTALPRALRVYDLTEPDWSRRMTEAQLREALRRLGEPFAPTRGEGDVRPIQVTAEARERFARFVEAETARRRSDAAP